MTPRAIPGFTASIDYWHINLKDIIESPSLPCILVLKQNQACILRGRGKTIGPNGGAHSSKASKKA